MTAAGNDVGKAQPGPAVDGHSGVDRFANARTGVTKLIKRRQTLGVTQVVARTVAALGRELALIEREMKTLIQEHASPALRLSKGLGPVFQATMLALLPELGHLSRRGIAKLVGVAPMNRDSGQGQGKRRIRGGRAAVRVALSMATPSAVRWDPLMKAHYQQLRARGKLAKVALVACMRRLLGIVKCPATR